MISCFLYLSHANPTSTIESFSTWNVVDAMELSIFVRILRPHSETALTNVLQFPSAIAWTTPTAQVTVTMELTVEQLLLMLLATSVLTHLDALELVIDLKMAVAAGSPVIKIARRTTSESVLMNLAHARDWLDQ